MIYLFILCIFLSNKNLYFLTYFLLYICYIFIYSNGNTKYILNAGFNMYDNFILKITNLWIHSENYYILSLFLLIFILIFLFYSNFKIYFDSFLEFLLIGILLYYNITKYIINYSIDISIVNPLLTHSLSLIHPPLILLSFFIFKCILIFQFYSLFYKLEIIKFNKLYYFCFFILLTGIILGSYWSVNLFGWGGWWIWDPIENIALIYFFLLLIIIHSNKKLFYYYLYLAFFIDYYFHFSYKINLFKSIHTFKINFIQFNINTVTIIIPLLFFIIIIIKLLINNINKDFKKIYYLYNYNNFIWLLHLIIFSSILIYLILHLQTIIQLFSSSIVMNYFTFILLNIQILFITLYILKKSIYIYSILIIFLFCLIINYESANYFFYLYIILIFLYSLNVKNKTLLFHNLFFTLFILFIINIQSVSELNYKLNLNHLILINKNYLFINPTIFETILYQKNIQSFFLFLTIINNIFIFTFSSWIQYLFYFKNNSINIDLNSLIQFITLFNSYFLKLEFNTLKILIMYQFTVLIIIYSLYIFSIYINGKKYTRFF